MKQRYLSLDFLRGLTIFGMVFSAIIPYGVLPAWMYHIQNPPPTHELDMSVSGIGWVDLVFPVFIFCMGAAIPLSGRGRIEKGLSMKDYCKGSFERFTMLWLFSYAYVLLNFNNLPGFWPQFATILGFLSFFPLYMVFNERIGGRLGKAVPFVRAAGFMVIVALIVLGHIFFDEQVNVQRRGIIIFLLAFLYLFGSLIWYFTRDNLKARLAIFGLVFLFTYITKELDYPAITYANKSIRWWFNMEYVYFLLLLLPATYVGDLLYERLNNASVRESDGRGSTTVYSEPTAWYTHLLFPSLVLFVAWLCYAFYMNITVVNMVVSVLFLTPVSLLVYKKLPQYRKFILIADLLLLGGLVMIWPEEGIKKVPCTISYCLATCSISILLLMVSDYICRYLNNSPFVFIFSGAGKNPLISYIAFDSFIVPLMKITGFISLYRAAYPAGLHAMGVIRAAVAVLFTMWCVALLSKKRIFWKA